MRKKYFVAQEDTDVYNVFGVDDFNAGGYLWEYNGEDGYHIDDFDIVYETDFFEDACAWVDRQLGYD